ncbi:MAG: 30S ribosomal protein S2 [Deltaproteobacteria bacterium]|nr:30S ribosomal protein S2 [Deltaproteobacteria bacterium]
MPVISLKEMLEAGVHFGHQTKRWNPKMRPYIFGERNGIHILDLQKTQALFDAAYNYVVETVSKGHKVLFVGTKKQASDVIKNEALRANMFYVTERWLGGTLTNFTTIRKSVERLKNIEKMEADGTFSKLPKKEVSRLLKEKTKLLNSLGGIKEMNKLPGVLFLVDATKEYIAKNEANKLGIPIIVLADTNCDPDGIDFLIPGNDDGIKSIQLFASKIADACLEGLKKYEEFMKEAKVREKTDEDKSDKVRKPGFDVEVIKRRKRTAIPQHVAKELEEEESIEEEAQKEAEAIMREREAYREESENN